MNTEDVMESGGLVDALARVLRQVIRTPKAREALTLTLNSVDPEGARELVRVLFWEDTALFLAVVGSVPSLADTLCELAAEAFAQLNMMPAPLLREVVARVLDGMDGSGAGEAAGGLVKLLLSLGIEGSSLPDSLARLAGRFKGAYIEAAGDAPLAGRLDGWLKALGTAAGDDASGTHALVRELGGALERNPEFVDNVLKPLLAPAFNSKPGAPGGKSGG